MRNVVPWNVKVVIHLGFGRVTWFIYVYAEESVSNIICKEFFLFPEVYTEHRQTSKTELFLKIVNFFREKFQLGSLAELWSFARKIAPTLKYNRMKTSYHNLESNTFFSIKPPISSQDRIQIESHTSWPV